jgi:flavin reductase (DIM6/NTAB) family NADH-FMN oxidoreductase RutF
MSKAESMVDLNPQQMERDDIYKILSGTVVPRPVAWVTTRSARGVVNAAPFSSYTLLSQDPPMILFQADARLREKDTIANIRTSAEFVVNAATMPQLEQMHGCAAAMDPDQSETDILGIALADSRMVSVPRIADAPIALECRLHQMFEIGRVPHTVVIGEVVCFRIRADLLVDGKIDQAALQPVARIGGPFYAALGEMIYKPAS